MTITRKKLNFLCTDNFLDVQYKLLLSRTLFVWETVILTDMICRKTIEYKYAEEHILTIKSKVFACNEVFNNL